MKRFLPKAVLALVSLALVSGMISAVSGAPFMRVKDLGWQRTNANASGIWRRDTTWLPLGAGAASCTTSAFTLDRVAALPLLFDAVADSTVIAALVFSMDTTGAVANGITAINCSLQVALPDKRLPLTSEGTVDGWTTIRLLSGKAANLSDRTITVPITVNNITSAVNNNSWAIFGLSLRGLVDADAITVPSCRVKVIYPYENP